MAWKCEASVVESVPGGVEGILAGVGGLSAETIESRALSTTGGIDANDGDGDKTSELVLECVRGWLVVLGLYYGNGLGQYQDVRK